MKILDFRTCHSRRQGTGYGSTGDTVNGGVPRRDTSGGSRIDTTKPYDGTGDTSSGSANDDKMINGIMNLNLADWKPDKVKTAKESGRFTTPKIGRLTLVVLHRDRNVRIQLVQVLLNNRHKRTILQT